MNKLNFNNETNKIQKRHTLLLLSTFIAFSSLLSACTSFNSREDSVREILKKENALIEKVKMERAQPNVVQAVSENEFLQKAELHLIQSLDEIKSANEMIQTKILKPKHQEVKRWEK